MFIYVKFKFICVYSICHSSFHRVRQGMTSKPAIPTEMHKSSGWRGSRELWLEAAIQTIIDQGVDAVKIQPLANRLNISRTSFYWFFKDRNALLEELLATWQAKNTGAFVGACDAYAGTIAEAVLNLIRVFHDDAMFEPQLDFAVRGWAHQSSEVADRVNSADDVRLGAICSMFERFGFDPEDADVRARTVYLSQIGYISMQVRESTDIRMARVARYVETFCGQPPSPEEMARFHAQLNYSPTAQSGP